MENDSHQAHLSNSSWILSMMVKFEDTFVSHCTLVEHRHLGYRVSSCLTIFKSVSCLVPYSWAKKPSLMTLKSDNHHKTGAFDVEHTKNNSITITLTILVIDSHSAFDSRTEQIKSHTTFLPSRNITFKGCHNFSKYEMVFGWSQFEWHTVLLGYR